jgi:tetratricopeptide (TPR) repeat protein
MASKIERLLDAEEWSAARRAIRAELRSDPKNHWLLTRLGLTYYEEKDYRHALECERRALAEAPHCPLVPRKPFDCPRARPSILSASTSRFEELDKNLRAGISLQ